MTRLPHGASLAGQILGCRGKVLPTTPPAPPWLSGASPAQRQLSRREDKMPGLSGYLLAQGQPTATSLTRQSGPRAHCGREGGGGRGLPVGPARKRETPGRPWGSRTRGRNSCQDAPLPCLGSATVPLHSSPARPLRHTPAPLGFRTRTPRGRPEARSLAPPSVEREARRCVLKRAAKGEGRHAYLVLPHATVATFTAGSVCEATGSMVSVLSSTAARTNADSCDKAGWQVGR